MSNRSRERFFDGCLWRRNARLLLMPVTLLLVLALSGCAASRSEIMDAYKLPVEKNTGAEKVSVFFLFKQMEQQHGLDAAPKLKAMPVKDFDNIFRDSLVEITNIENYATDTEQPYDVNSPDRRQQREMLRGSHDYTLDIRIMEESSFAQHCLSGLISAVSLTVIPMPFTWHYTMNVNLYDKSGKLVRTYQRRAKLSNWAEAFLIFVYPFHPIEGKREEIYAGFLHDLFRQIEAEKVLKKPSSFSMM